MKKIFVILVVIVIFFSSGYSQEKGRRFDRIKTVKTFLGTKLDYDSIMVCRYYQGGKSKHYYIEEEIIYATHPHKKAIYIEENYLVLFKTGELFFEDHSYPEPAKPIKGDILVLGGEVFVVLRDHKKQHYTPIKHMK